MLEHSRGPNYNSPSDGAMHTHSSSMGHEMDLDNPTNVFRSDCNYTRSAVEAALIHVAPTIQGNTATSSTRSDDLVAPVICRSVRFKWEIYLTVFHILIRDQSLGTRDRCLGIVTS